jgi:hypothetical protein
MCEVKYRKVLIKQKRMSCLYIRTRILSLSLADIYETIMYLRVMNSIYLFIYDWFNDDFTITDNIILMLIPVVVCSTA